MSGDTLLRQWALLRALPTHRDATTRELHDALLQEGYEVDKRTVERDLKELQYTFPLLLNDKGRPYGWRWDPQARLLDIPGMDPATALTFKLAESFLSPLLPASTLDGMRRHFTRADEVLGNARTPLRDWVKKVQVISRGQRLKAPESDPALQARIYQALLEERRFKARYRKKHGEYKEYEISPLGLVLRDQITYLVATAWDYGDPLQFALHRFEAVELLDEPITAPEGFDLQAYVRENHFDYPEGESLQLDLLMDKSAALHLRETPLSDDQQWEELADGQVRLTATVSDTQQLRWWLLGFGDQVEVVGPAGLRGEFGRIAGRLASRYSVQAGWSRG